MKNLSFGDVCGIVVSWAGAAAIAYLTKDTVIPLLCLASAYYLTKFIILKKES